MRLWRCRSLHLISLLAFPATSSAIWPFEPKRFSGNALITAGSMGLTDPGRVVAFGDFNGDQFLDVLMLGNDRRTLSVYLWNHEEYAFQRSFTMKHSNDVYNVVPGDFTHSGKLDLLVMSGSWASASLDLSVYPALVDGGLDVKNPFLIDSSSQSQPIPLDLNGDMKIDLLGMTPSSQHSSGDTFQTWKNVWNASQPHSPLFELTDSPFHGTQCTISNPHSNAVVDLDGDCLADVFLVCDNGNGVKYFQIWINNKDNGFSLAHQGSLPSGIQSITFADIDRDGTIDMVFTTCNSVSGSTGVGSNCYINIAFNQQLPLCAASQTPFSKGVRICRPPDNLCVADPGFKFEFSGNSNVFVRFPITALFPDENSPSLLVQDTTFSPSIPISVKLGDANLDGFPDILLVMSTSHGRTPKLIYSVPCARGKAGCDQDGNGKRGWQVATKGVESLDKVKDARGVSFVDIDEDGTLDLMVHRTGDSGEGNVLFVQNNFYYDAFFLKAIVLNGACNNGWCYTPDGGQYHPFGVSYSGASYKYTVLDLSGRRSAAQVGQLPQTSYHALQSPYSFFGLGRTNNYIENLFVGSTIHLETHYINMEGVIPNSKVVILPSANEGEAWKRELFLRPGDWIPWVTVTVVAGTAILAIIVLVLHLNEKREDELERRRASHHINFDAL
ncbi:hypothetical protein EV361DRAFT_914190 [Lentinula raphanica]|uniref:T-cell immunomodulatory protein TIP C2 domain-containing protein n=1 Tax=Lentinula raphanica TaxID=153919 RepID=A0AA38P2X4_9AGAR|nr:hypothetical protein F5880DRAFT_1623942 [Lentinula raphanica]KAJ3835226.1 hypothetical protein F5878DRAFT_628527 [Lentinula raphanica]KAJ3970834.1 hypothetical protein EV361DRAFT_914190 [Lentinula raphanica]